MRVLSTCILVSWTLLCLIGGSAEASSYWKSVKRFLSKDVKIVKETPELLVLYSEQIEQTFTLSNGYHPEADLMDVYGAVKQKRGGNPYRIWYSSEKLSAREELPKKLWGHFLRAEFLRLIRPYKKE